MKITSQDVNQEILSKFFKELEDIIDFDIRHNTFIFPLDVADVDKFVSDNCDTNKEIMVDVRQENIYSKITLCEMYSKSKTNLVLVDTIKLPQVRFKTLLAAKCKFDVEKIKKVSELYEQYFQNRDIDCFLYEPVFSPIIYIND